MTSTHTDTTYAYAPQVLEAASALKKNIGSTPELLIVAGSGFRDALPPLDNMKTLSMSDIPNVPAPGVAGHGSHFLWGTSAGKTILVATGRVHLYEGRTCDEVVFVVRMAAAMGVKGLILTNAAGSVDRKLPAGTLVLIKDQLNLTGFSAETAQKPRITFTDMMNCYDAAWRGRVAKLCKLPEGVYAGLTGPAYETMAEAHMLATLGAHTVGMSTVQECITARTIGMKVLGLSFVTNLAGGLGGAIDHKDVLAVAQSNKPLLQQALVSATTAF